MHIGSRALAAGASYRLISPRETMLHLVEAGGRDLRRPHRLAARARPRATSPRCCASAGKRVAVLRHPMPYGDLTKQAVQRFERYEDLDAADATIEEREEYEPHIAEGNLVFAGIDYAAILDRRRAGGRRDPLGRRQQRHAVREAERPHRRRRPAPGRPRAALPPGRDEPAHGRRLRREQGRQRDAGRHRRRARLDPHAQPAARRSCSPPRRSTSRATSPRSPASACSRSRTGRR